MSTTRAVQVVGYHRNLEMTEVPVPEATDLCDPMGLAAGRVRGRAILVP